MTLASLAAGCALGCYPLLRAGPLVPVAAAFAIVATVFLAAGLLGFLGAVPWALGLLGASFTIVDLSQGEPLAAAPFYGAGLLLTAELAYASRALRRGSGGLVGRQLGWIVGVTGAGLVAGFVAVEAVGVSGPTGLPAELIAVAAAVSLLALPAFLLRARFGRGVS